MGRILGNAVASVDREAGPDTRVCLERLAKESEKQDAAISSLKRQIEAGGGGGGGEEEFLGTVTNTGGDLDNDLVVLGAGGPDVKTLATDLTGKFLRDDSTWVAIPGGGDALTSNPLSQFAATTSAQLASVISDENGSGKVLFADGTITITAGKTLTGTNTVTLTGTDGSTITFGAGGTVVYTSDIGLTVQPFDSTLVNWAGVDFVAAVGTFLATPSSANLADAMTDETGSGKLVFNDTPSIMDLVLVDAVSSFGTSIDTSSITGNQVLQLNDASATAGRKNIITGGDETAGTGVAIFEALSQIRTLTWFTVDDASFEVRIGDNDNDATLVLSGVAGPDAKVYARSSGGNNKGYLDIDAANGSWEISGTHATNPILAVIGATGMSADKFNKVAITQPATGSTLTIQDGFTLTVSANATVSGTNTGDQTVPVKATGSEINTGTDDAKFATAKAITDSNVAFTSDIPSMATIAAAMYPVGSIYCAVVSTNPNTLLGMGTWAAFGAGRVMVGLNSGDTDFDTVEETGGAKTVAAAGSNAAEATHTHTYTQTLDHVHTVNVGSANDTSTVTGAGNSFAGTTSSIIATTANPTGSAGATGTTSAGASHNHTFTGSATSVVQPYIVVYMWKRTA